MLRRLAILVVPKLTKRQRNIRRRKHSKLENEALFSKTRFWILVLRFELQFWVICAKGFVFNFVSPHFTKIKLVWKGKYNFSHILKDLLIFFLLPFWHVLFILVPFHPNLEFLPFLDFSRCFMSCLLVVMVTNPFYVGRAETRDHVMKFTTKAF